MLHLKRLKTQAKCELIQKKKHEVSQEILCGAATSMCVYHQKGNSIWLFLI